MIEECYIKARKKWQEDHGKEDCDEHVMSHYIGQESLKYVAVCLVCYKVMTGKELQEWALGAGL